MYDGEVNIFQDDLDRFLAMAQRFKLEGLLDDPQQEEEHSVVPEEELSTPHAKPYSIPFKKEKYRNPNHRPQRPRNISNY